MKHPIKHLTTSLLSLLSKQYSIKDKLEIKKLEKWGNKKPELLIYNKKAETEKPKKSRIYKNFYHEFQKLPSVYFFDCG
ncbi:hypothetical protein TXIAM_230072 [Tenacibaculum xiamenense]